VIDIVICHPKRTPVGRYGGVLRDIAPQGLAATVIRSVLDESGLDPDSVDDVILGHGYPTGENPAIGRVAALNAGLPTTVPGAQVDRRCGSGLWAVLTAAAQVGAGASDVVLAGGAESMSQAEHYAVGLRFAGRPGDIVLHDRLGRGRVTAGGDLYPVPGGMIETAENLRRDFGIPREEQDELALRSHQRAVAAQQAGRFDQEIVPVALPDSPDAWVSGDEHPRSDSTLAKLASLKAVRRSVDPEATITAGNASGQNDGAAVCIVTTRDTADRLGLNPALKLVSWALSGVAPDRMGLGPVPATELALKRAGLSLADMDLIELNEAFAAQVLAVTRSWGFTQVDHERLNVNGSGISLGHPVGATGARMLATLSYEVQRRRARYGLATMCIGGGQGLAAIFERA
jgi:acetyl-CoA C-acetyltransferase